MDLLSLTRENLKYFSKVSPELNCYIKNIKDFEGDIQNNKAFNFIPEFIIIYFLKKVRKGFDQTLIIKDKNFRYRLRRSLLRKYKHSYQMLLAAFDIISKLGEKFHLNLYQVAIGSYLHDIGRFVEYSKDGINNHDHAQIGYNQFRKDLKRDRSLEKTLKCFNCNIKSILNVIRKHSKYKYYGDDKYVHLARDADKLSLLRNYNLQMGFIKDLKDLKGWSVTDRCRSDFVNLGVVINGNMMSKGDIILRNISYFKQFYFDRTKSIAVKEKLYFKWEAVLKKYVKKVDIDILKKCREINSNLYN